MFTYQATLPVIEHKKAEYLRQAVYQVLPGAVASVPFGIDDQEHIFPLAGDEEAANKVYAGYDTSGKLIGIALEARGQGFQDVIRLLYGYAPDRQAVIGMRVLESRETPGLGDKIEKDPKFQANFEALAVDLNPDDTVIHPIEMVKAGAKTEPWQIDAISGATISSKAVSAMLRENTARWIPVLARNRLIFEEHRP